MDTTASPEPLAEAVRLTPVFDAARLDAELAEVTGHRWQPQRINAPGGQAGRAAAIDWRVLPLRSPGGDKGRTDPGGPGPVGFAPTAWMNRLPYLREILASLPAPLNAVRLMALGPGAVSQPHRDPKYALHRGFVRLHIPLVTHPDAVLVLDAVEHCWQPGELWYGDFSREHLVRNTGPATRVHTVIDALLTRELARWFPRPWQDALDDGEALFNHLELLSAPHPKPVQYAVSLPAGFTDFDHDRPLQGPIRHAHVTGADGQLTLTTPERAFALVPAGPAEHRFTGWSEQRTLQLADDGVRLFARRGRTCTERFLPSPAAG
jgi:aspartate beta-hydroxylase